MSVIDQELPECVLRGPRATWKPVGPVAAVEYGDVFHSRQRVSLEHGLLFLLLCCLFLLWLSGVSVFDELGENEWCVVFVVGTKRGRQSSGKLPRSPPVLSLGGTGPAPAKSETCASQHQPRK